MSEANYWTKDADGAERGPYTRADVERYLREGHLSRDVQVREGERGEWKPADASGLRSRPVSRGPLVFISLIVAVIGMTRGLYACSSGCMRQGERQTTFEGVDRGATCWSDCSSLLGGSDSLATASCRDACVHAKAQMPNIDFPATYKGCLMPCAITGPDDAGPTYLPDCMAACAERHAGVVPAAARR